MAATAPAHADKAPTAAEQRGSRQECSPRQLLCSLDFWCLWLAIFVVSGLELMVTANLAQTVKAVTRDELEQTVHSMQTLMSALSAFGRVFFGSVSDRVRCPRPVWLGVSALLSGLGCLVRLAAPGLGGIYAGVALGQFGAGGMWTINPVLNCELFGVKNMGLNTALLQVAVPLGVTLFNTGLAVPVYRAHSNAAGTDCSGEECFRLTFAVCAGAGLLAALPAFLLAWRTRAFYRGPATPKSTWSPGIGSTRDKDVDFPTTASVSMRPS